MRLSLLNALMKRKKVNSQSHGSSLLAAVEELPPQRLQLLAELLKKKNCSYSHRVIPMQEQAEPTLVPSPSERYQSFPLTDLQQAYFMGRSTAFHHGKTASHCYLEVEAADLCLRELEDSLNRLIQRHDMLRERISSDGIQQILESVPRYTIRINDFQNTPEEETTEQLEQIRYRLSHNVLPLENWPLFEIQASLLKDRRVRLHISLDGLVFDGWSITLFLKEWAAFYRKQDAALAPLELSIRDYVLAEKGLEKTPAFLRAKEYWKEKIKDLAPAPQLPIAKNPSQMDRGRFVRRRGIFEKERWQNLKQRAFRAGLTSTGLLVSVYAEVLALWSKERHFTLSVPSFNRYPLHPQVKQLIGECASFSLLDIDNTGNESFENRAKKHQQVLWKDIDHRHFNGVKVIRELAQAHNSPTGVLMPIVFTASPQDETGEDAYPTLAAEELGECVFAVNQTTQVWLDNHVSEQKGALVCDWDSVDEIFPEGLSRTLFDAFFRLLHKLEEDEAFWKSSASEIASFLMPSGQLAIRETINSQTAPIPDGLLQDSFFAQAESQPDSMALLSNRRCFTYRELALLANQWGRRLQELGAVPNQPIAVVMGKGWEQVVAVLGILQAGAPYLPIDARMPKERLWKILKNSGAKIVLTQSWLENELDFPVDIQRLCVDRENYEDWDAKPPIQKQTPEDLAYIIYTSGSTGEPKGVMIGHRGVVNCIAQTQERFQIGPKDRLLGVTALHHDMSVFDIFGILSAGGTYIIPDDAGRRDPAHWSEWMQRGIVTVWNSVPAMMEMLLEYAQTKSKAIPPTLRLAFLGGDWISTSLPERLNKHVSGTRIVSVGGPTETTLWNIWDPVEEQNTKSLTIPYGSPIPNAQYYVLNELLEHCPDWVPGELCCAGVGLAKGYWKDEEKTQEKFLYHNGLGKWLYRTGDIGRYRADGIIEFLGRKDLQVKIQGQRIELGEIEAALKQHPRIQNAIAIAKTASNGNRILVAYYVTENGLPCDSAELCKFLSAKLPDYMIPSHCIHLKSFPLTANGKVDRNALPEPAPLTEAEPSKPAQENSEMTNKIHRIVSKVLGVERFDWNANFLALGASSIDMVRIGNELGKEFGTRPKMEELFRMQSVRELAERYSGSGETSRATSVSQLVGGQTALQKRLAGYTVLIEPCKRAEFKNSRPGIRRNVDGKRSIPLSEPVNLEELKQMFWERRSYRQFSLRPIPLHQFSGFLTCLMEMQIHGKAKTLYGTPGGLNPTQVYLYVKKGRIEGVEQGIYYYHPIEHLLICIQEQAAIDRGIHTPFVNQPIFDESAFSIFLIAQLDAIGPSYGEPSLHYLTLEAGIISQLMEMWAPSYNIGLCQIGFVELEEARLRELFELDETHVLIHSLLGGYVSREEIEGPPKEKEGFNNPCAARSDYESKVAHLMNRIKQLSKDDVRKMLDARRPEGKA